MYKIQRNNKFSVSSLSLDVSILKVDLCVLAVGHIEDLPLFFVFDEAERGRGGRSINKCKRRNVARRRRESAYGKNGGISSVPYRCTNLPGIIRSREISERRSRAERCTRRYTATAARKLT